METKTDSTHTSLKWLEIWSIAFLHPTVKTYSKIINDPKASIEWGIIWTAISAFIAWFIGPQRTMLTAIVADTFGRDAVFSFLVIGAIVGPISSVIVMLITSAISHGFARLFGGVGAFHQLVYGWGVIQPPFTLLSGLVALFPSILSHSRSFALSTVGTIIMVISLLAIIGIKLYQIYAGIVAFSTVEEFGIWKSLGILSLQAIVVGIAVFCLSFGFQALRMNFARRYF